MRQCLLAATCSPPLRARHKSIERDPDHNSRRRGCHSVLQILPNSDGRTGHLPVNLTLDVTIQPYDAPRQLTPGVHLVDGRWRRSPMQRRMTVLAGPERAIAIHSAIELEDADLGWLDGLGTVSLILVPNRYHCSDASFYAERYPEARVLVPSQIEPEMRRRLQRVDGILEGELWQDALSAWPLGGTRIGEALVYHRQSRTLIATDVVFNYSAEDFRGLPRWLMRINGAVDHFGPTRLFRRYFLRDREAFATSMRPVLDLDVERIVMSHGHVIESNGANRLRDAFADLVHT